MPSHLNYTVGWIAALPDALAAANAMLDERHPDLPQASNGEKTYTLGCIFGQNVVITSLPAGGDSTASVVSNMQSNFPNLEYVLMVGIGGGAPSDNHDIRLGDVVVGIATNTFGGVLQYDFASVVAGEGIHRSGKLNQPLDSLLARVTYLQDERVGSRHHISTVLVDRLKDADQAGGGVFARPGAETDLLFQASYDHIGAVEGHCARCDMEMLISRPPRGCSHPKVHCGLIASGDQVMKDGRLRDDLSGYFGGALCFETEAAGLVSELPCLVIRGICDYADSHRNENWRRYAAFTAAAYARLLLSMVDAWQEPGRVSKLREDFNGEEVECLQGLFVTDPADDRSALIARNGPHVPGTCEWILKTDEVVKWLGPESTESNNGGNVLWLHGNPGIGKTAIAVAISEEIPWLLPFQEGRQNVAYFFCDSSSPARRTANGIFRGLIFQLITQRPELMTYLLKRYRKHGRGLFSSFDALWHTLMDFGGPNVASRQYCIIDGLDECDQDSQETLCAQLHNTFRPSSPPYPRVSFLITSRPCPEIRENLGHFNNKDLSSYSRLRGDVSLYIQSKVKELTEKKHYTEHIAKSVSGMLWVKAEGTFLWAGLACSELASVGLRETVKTLYAYPQGLYHLYQRILDSSREAEGAGTGPSMLLKILFSVAVGMRPLRLSDLADALRSNKTKQEEELLALIKENIERCRLLVVLPDSSVRLVHQSVRDFLIGSGEKIYQVAHEFLANTCIICIRRSCRNPTPTEGLGCRSTFLQYAALYWPEHASRAGKEFKITDRNRSFLRDGSIELKAWLQMYNQAKTQSELPESFTVLHIAARWGILPLIRFVMETGPMTANEELSPGFSFDDAKFAAGDGRTPMEEAARAGQVDALKVFLETSSQVSIGVVLEAASNEENGDTLIATIMATVVEKRPDALEILPSLTEAGITTAAAQNKGRGKQVTELLLNFGGDDPPITQEVLEAAVRNRFSGKEVIRLLLDHRRNEVEITQSVWVAATENEESGKDIVALLLDEGYDNFEISEELVEAAAATGGDIMIVFLDPRYNHAKVTPEAVVVARERFSTGTLGLLLDREGQQRPAAGGVPDNIDRQETAPPASPGAPQVPSLTSDRPSAPQPTPGGNGPQPSAEQSVPIDPIRNPTQEDHPSLMHTLRGHTQCVWNLKVAPRTNLIASTSSDMTVRLWDSVTGTLLHELEQWPEPPRAAAISPDLTTVAVALRDGTFTIWDGRNRGLSVGGYFGPISVMTCSANGEIIAVGYVDGAVRLWDRVTGKLLRSLIGHSDSVTCLAFSGDNRRIASGSKDTTVRIWDKATGDNLRRLYGLPGSLIVTAVALSSNGGIVASGYEDGTVKECEPWQWLFFRTLRGHSSSIGGLGFSPNDDYLVSASQDSTVNVWKNDSGALERTLSGHSGSVSKIRFSSKGKFVAAGTGEGTAPIWEFYTGGLLRTLKLGEPVDDIAFSHESDTIACASSSGLLCKWSMHPNGWSTSHGGGTRWYSLAFSPDGETLATAAYSRMIRLWSCRTGALSRTLDGHQSSCQALEFSPDGKTLASGSDDGSVIFWDVDTGRATSVLRGHLTPVVDMAFSADGRILASVSFDGAIKIWKPSSGTLVRGLSRQEYTTQKWVGLSPNGLFAVTNLRYSTLGIWNLNTGAMQQIDADSSYISAVRVSPDGNTVATASRDSGTIKLWDLATGTLLGTLEGDQQHISNISFSPNGRLLASSSMGSLVRVLDLASKTVVHTLRGHSGGVIPVSFSPDGTFLTSGGHDRTIRIWAVNQDSIIGSP